MSWVRWSREYWSSACRERIGADHVAACVWQWLVCSSHANSLGVYRVPWRVAWVELYLGSETEGREAVSRTVELVGPGSARLSGDWVWVVGASVRQHEPILSSKDNRCKSRAFREELEVVKRSPFWASWWRVNDVHFRLADLGVPCPVELAVEGVERSEAPPSKGVTGVSEGSALPIPSHPFPSHPFPPLGARGQRCKDEEATGRMMADLKAASLSVWEVVSGLPVWVEFVTPDGFFVLGGLVEGRRAVERALPGRVFNG